jgi:WD40 repeat protein
MTPSIAATTKTRRHKGFISSFLRVFLSAFVPSWLLFSPLVHAADQPKINYQDHILPLFRNSCLNCHNPDKKKGGLDLSTYAAALAGADSEKVINPGDPETSILYKLVMHLDEPKMPQKSDKLPAKELALIRQWIEQGALETATGKPAAPTRAKVDLSINLSSLSNPSGPPPMPKSVPTVPVVIPRHAGPLNSLATAPWSPLVAIGGQKQVLLYNTDTLALMGILPFPEGQPNSLAFSRSGSMLLVAGGIGAKSGKAVLFDIATGKRVAEIGDEFDAVLCADLSPDQTTVAIGTTARMLKIYSTSDGALQQSIKKHTDWVTAIAYSPDGKYLASADRAGNVYVWEAKAVREVFNLQGHKAGITALSFRPDSKLLASASEDGTIKLWDMTSGLPFKSISAHPSGVLDVHFANDGRLISAGRDKLARIWKPDGTPEKTFPAFPDIVLRSALTSDEAKAIAADFSGQIKVFSATDGKPTGTLSSIPPK